MLLPILVQNIVSPSRSATSVTKWKNPAISPQGSMREWFVISIQGWHRCHPCLTKKKLDKSELVDSLAKKAPRGHIAMLILKGFNPETGDMTTFVENCKLAKTTDNIAVPKFYASDKDSDTKIHKKRSKFKECEEKGKKRHKKNSSLYCYFHGVG